MRARLVFFAAALCVLALTATVLRTRTAYAQQRGGGQRGAPAPGAQPQGPGGGGFRRGNTPTFPGPPAGMQALPSDLFTSKNFYKDQALWLDKRYFRCNSPPPDNG
jgi:hypothetical protein